MTDIILTLVSRGFGWNLMREIFTSLDGAIFDLFSAVIQLMFDIVSVSVKAEFFKGIYDRVYLILSIYMLFKVTVSLVTYVVNPDGITDKSQGIGNLVQRIIVSIVLLAIIPTAFDKLAKYQEDIITDGTINNIILGSDSVNDVQNSGDKIGLDVYNGFIVRPRGATLNNTSVIHRSDITKVSDWSGVINEPVDNQKDIYKYEYIPFIGFVMGAFMTILILSFCIDLAIRAFKLIILQLIAPIPVISYIDPKQAKDGAFSKWLRLLISTWASLFVRLIVIDFILLVIKNITNTNMIDFKNGGIMVRIALIIGLLYFAKNLPKFIYDALGMKQPERGLFAGLGNIAAAGAIGLGAFGAGVAAGRANYMADEALGKEHNIGRYLKNVGAGLFGGASGIVAGAGAAVSAKDHNARAVNEALAKRNQLALRRGAAGSTGLGRARESLSQMFTGQTAFDRRKKEVEALDSMVKNTSAFQNNLKSEASKGKYGQIKIDGKGGYMGDQKLTGNSKILRSEGQLALSNGDEWFYHDNGDGTTSKVSTKEFERIAGDMEKAEMQSLYELFQNGDTSTIENNPDLYAEYQTVVEEANALGFDTTTSKSLDDSKKQAQADSYNTKATREYKAGQANSNEVKK